MLALAGVTYTALQSLVIPAVPDIAESLDASTAATGWIVTIYLVSACIATAVAGRVGDMIGRKRTLVVILVILCGGTLVCALAPTLAWLVTGRALQGVSGAVFPLAFGIIRDEFPADRVASGIALMSAVLPVGGTTGVLLAGPILEHLPYTWLFWFPLMLAVPITIATAVVIPESPSPPGGRVDWVGGLLLAGWIVGILAAITQGPSWGWESARVLGLLAVSLAILVLWLRVETTTEDPLVDPGMLWSPVAGSVNAVSALFAFSAMTATVAIPLFVVLPTAGGLGFGASGLQVSLYIVPSMLGSIVGSAASGRLAARVGAKAAVVASTVVLALGIGALAFAHAAPWQVYLFMAVTGVGTGLAIGATTNLLVHGVPPDRTGVATGVNIIGRTLGTATGAQVCVTLVTALALESGEPTSTGITVALCVGAGAAAGAVAISLLIPEESIRRNVLPEPAAS